VKGGADGSPSRGAIRAPRRRTREGGRTRTAALARGNTGSSKSYRQHHSRRYRRGREPDDVVCAVEHSGSSSQTSSPYRAARRARQAPAPVNCAGLAAQRLSDTIKHNPLNCGNAIFRLDERRRQGAPVVEEPVIWAYDHLRLPSTRTSRGSSRRTGHRPGVALRRRGCRSVSRVVRGSRALPSRPACRRSRP